MVLAISLAVIWWYWGIAGFLIASCEISARIAVALGAEVRSDTYDRFLAAPFVFAAMVVVAWLPYFIQELTKDNVALLPWWLRWPLYLFWWAPVVLVMIVLFISPTFLILTFLDEQLAGVNADPENGRFALGVFAVFGVVALLFGISCIARGSWLAFVARQIRNIPTSTVRAAAVGPVEIAGTLRPIEGSGDSTIVTAMRAESCWLEDETGRVRIEPPEHEGNMDPRFETGPKGSLVGGDEAVALGYFDAGVLRPWTPRFGVLLARVSVWILLRGYAMTDVFFLGVRRPSEAFDRLFRWRFWWIGLGAALALGGFTWIVLGTWIQIVDYGALRNLAINIFW